MRVRRARGLLVVELGGWVSSIVSCFSRSRFVVFRLEELGEEVDVEGRVAMVNSLGLLSILPSMKGIVKTNCDYSLRSRILIVDSKIVTNLVSYKHINNDLSN